MATIFASPGDNVWVGGVLYVVVDVNNDGNDDLADAIMQHDPRTHYTLRRVMPICAGCGDETGDDVRIGDDVFCEACIMSTLHAVALSHVLEEAMTNGAIARVIESDVVARDRARRDGTQYIDVHASAHDMFVGHTRRTRDAHMIDVVNDVRHMFDTSFPIVDNNDNKESS